jgi:hypothetical protein
MKSSDTMGDSSDAFVAKDIRTNRLHEGWTVDAESGGVVGDRDDDHKGWSEIGNSQELVSVYNGAELRSFYRSLFGESFITQPDCTWLRMKGRGEATVEHAVSLG